MRHRSIEGSESRECKEVKMVDESKMEDLNFFLYSGYYSICRKNILLYILYFVGRQRHVGSNLLDTIIYYYATGNKL